MCGVSNYFKYPDNCAHYVFNEIIPFIRNVHHQTYIITPNKLKFEYKCKSSGNLPPPQKTIEVQGTLKLTLDIACHLTSDKYVIYPNTNTYSFKDFEPSTSQLGYQKLSSNVNTDIKITTPHSKAYTAYDDPTVLLSHQTSHNPVTYTILAILSFIQLATLTFISIIWHWSSSPNQSKTLNKIELNPIPTDVGTQSSSDSASNPISQPQETSAKSPWQFQKFRLLSQNPFSRSLQYSPNQ